ncbi:MAG: hypothetical protein KC438_05410, partial [Thermomicrobiales bacterium]|nr:hypothetical protein [Thermomicrobiales bacterium]
MGLLDRIGKALKTAADEIETTKTASTPAEAPKNVEPQTADAPSSTKGLFGSAEDAVPAQPTAAPASTKGLFGAPPGEAEAAAPAAKTDPPASTRTLQSDGPSSTVAETAEEQIVPVTRKVLMIVHNPPVPSEGNKRLTEIFKWHDPDKLAKGYIDDLRNCSGGYLNYDIVERIDSDIFPRKQDGFTYTPDEYVKVMRGEAKPHDPDWLDYHARIEQFNLLERFNHGDFHEVWFFSFPYGGEYESIMGGPGGFWCNAPPIKNTDRFRQRFVMMGFNMERG